MSRDRRPADIPDQNFASLPLADFIPAISPDLVAPLHMPDYLDLLGNLAGGDLRVCVSCPPQHGKTTSVLHAIAWTLLRHPKIKIAYASHGQHFSEEQSRIVRELYMLAGGKLKPDFNTIAQWKTEQGGGLFATSWQGSLIGRRVDVMVCDDLIKDAQQAESAEQREHIWRWINSILTQRLWVGASVVVIGSRWHYDDPSGRLIARGYRELCMPAIRVDEDGVEHALWPEVKPLAWLNRLRDPHSPDYIGEHDWGAAYQGKPTPRSGNLFGPPTYYETLPEGASVAAIGVDVATSDASASDFSAVVVLAQRGDVFFVHDVHIAQRQMIEIKAMLERVCAAYPGVRMACYTSGPEKGILNLLFHDGIHVERIPAKFSKFVRSQRAAQAWRQGRIQVRKGQPWTHRFAREVEFFTGAEGARDDQVDALVSAMALVQMGAPVQWAAGGFTFGRPVM